VAAAVASDRPLSYPITPQPTPVLYPGVETLREAPAQLRLWRKAQWRLADALEQLDNAQAVLVYEAGQPDPVIDRLKRLVQYERELLGVVDQYHGQLIQHYEHAIAVAPRILPPVLQHYAALAVDREHTLFLHLLSNNQFRSSALACVLSAHVMREAAASSPALCAAVDELHRNLREGIPVSFPDPAWRPPDANGLAWADATFAAPTDLNALLCLAPTTGTPSVELVWPAEGGERREDLGNWLTLVDPGANVLILSKSLADTLGLPLEPYSGTLTQVSGQVGTDYQVSGGLQLSFCAQHPLFGMHVSTVMVLVQDTASHDVILGMSGLGPLQECWCTKLVQQPAPSHASSRTRLLGSCSIRSAGQAWDTAASPLLMTWPFTAARQKSILNMWQLCWTCCMAVGSECILRSQSVALQLCLTWAMLCRSLV
jgi:hypothetical protein